MPQNTSMPDDFVLELTQPVTPVQDDFVLGPVMPDAKSRNWLERNVSDPFMRGVDSAGMALQSAKALSGGTSVADFMDMVSQHNFNQQLNPVHPDDQALMEKISGQDFWGAAGTYLTNPGLIAQISAQSLPASAPSIAAGTAGGIAGGAAGPAGAFAGGALGAGVGSGMTEYMMSVSDAILENPAIAKEADLASLLQNDEFLGRVYDHAAKRGLGVGVLDAISFGLAGKVFKPIEQAAGRALAAPLARGAGAAGEVAAQGAMGATGEAAAQQLSEGKISNQGDIAGEFFGELGSAPMEIGGAILSRQGHGANAAPAQEAPLPDDFVVEPSPEEQAAQQNAAAQADASEQATNINTGQAIPPEAMQILQPKAKPEPTTPVDPNAPRLASDPYGTEPTDPNLSTDPAVQVQQPEPVAGPDLTPSNEGQNTNPAPAQAQTQPTRTEKVTTPDRSVEIPVDWEVIDADQLKSAEGQDQPRDRMRQGSTEQINNIAANLDPMALMGSRETDRGAPIIDDNNVILSGNGRTQAMMLAAEKNPERYQAYLASLRAEGFNTDGLKTPILVRRAKGLAPENRRKLVTGSNSQGSMGLAPSEQARVDRDYISDEMLAGFDPDVEGGVAAASNAGFVNDFVKRMPPNEAATLKNGDGALSPAGAARVQNAIFARAYDDQRLIERSTESADDVSIRNALLGAAGAWANMRNKAPTWDITKDLVAALDLIKSARDKGVSVQDYLDQIDAFAEPVPAKVQQIAKLFLNPTGRRLASGKDMRARLTAYAKQATDDSNAGGDLLGGRAGPDEVLNNLTQGIAKSTDKDGPEQTNAPAKGAELFPQGQTLSTGPKKGGGSKAGQKIAAGPMLDGVGVAPPVSSASAPQSAGTARKVDSSAANDGGFEVEVFHGTLEDFEVFDPEALGSNTNAADAKLGFFFTDSPVVADGYATDNQYPTWITGRAGRAYMKLNEALARLLRMKPGITKGRILRAKIKFGNPLTHDAKGGELRARERAAILSEAKANGHDVVVFENVIDPGLTDESADAQSNVYVVFDPAQVEIVSSEPATSFADAPARKPQGTLAPQTTEVSFTNRQSVNEEAYRAAGLTPDEGVLLPPEKKRSLLRKLMVSTFGFKDLILDAARLKISTQEAVNQMLDAYRNVRFMMHVLALPIKGVSLNGTLTLQLERNTNRYFGVYSPAERSIGLPGRSNSFAHEWAHALDHYLMDALNKSGKMGVLLSHAARNGGLDVANSLEEAFAHLVNTMFFDESALAARVFDLEQKAGAVHQNGPNQGKPTKGALEAQAQIEKLVKGATRLKLKPSEYRQQSKDFQPGGTYFPSVHEMLARAFEAYVANKMAAAGGGNEFITKGEEAYLSDADARLAMTYPKGDDRLKIFAALDQVFDHLRVQQVLGTEPAAGRPDDVDILDPQHWNKQALALGEPGPLELLKKEAFALRNQARNLWNKQALMGGISEFAANAGFNLKAIPKKVADGMLDKARYFFGTSRSYMNARISRNNGKGADFMSFIWDRFAAQPGSASTHVGSVFEEERERAALKVANEVDSLLRANVGRLKLTEAESNTVRGLMYDGKVAGADPRLVKIAAGLRRIMERVYADGKNAGIQMGYVENQGYLPRILLTDRVQQDPTGFKRDAEKVYDIVFSKLTDKMEAEDTLRLATATARRKDPLTPESVFSKEVAQVKAALKALKKAEEGGKDAEIIQAMKAVDQANTDLKDAVRPVFNDVSARDWTQAVVVGDSASYDSHGPGANFTKTRTLPPEADKIMEAWHETDPVHMVVEYTHKVSSRASYVRRAGMPGGADKLNDVIGRKDVKNFIRANPGKYNPDTVKGRMAILRDLANPTQDNILEMALDEAGRAGAYGPDVRELRGLIEDFSGRKSRGPLGDMVQRAAGVAYTFTYIALLSRAAITGATEPLTVMLRTGDLKVSLQTFGAFLGEAVRVSKTTQERAAIARAIGLTTTALHDVLLLNRLDADSAQMFRGNGLMARFFRANLLSQLTNAQRRASMTGGFLWMQSMAHEHAGPKAGASRKKIIAAEFRELGISEENLPSFMDWLTQVQGLPELGDLDSSAGKLFQDAIGRFVDQVIQNPRRADKPVLTGNPVGAVAYSLTSFLYTFFSNVHGAIATRAQRDYAIRTGEGESKTRAALGSATDAAWTFGSGFALIYMGQLVTTMAREAIFNSEQWEKKREAGELEAWLASLAFSRSGITGPADIPLNALTGLRYERDLSNLFVGPGVSYVLSNMANIARGMGLSGRNSPNTNVAEREGWKSAYRLFIAPAATAALSAMDVVGPLGTMGRYSALTYLSSNSAASSFADTMAGPRE